MRARIVAAEVRRLNYPFGFALCLLNTVSLRACCPTRAATPWGVAQTFLSAVSQVFQPAGQGNAEPLRRFVAPADRNVCATLGNTPVRRL